MTTLSKEICLEVRWVPEGGCSGGDGDDSLDFKEMDPRSTILLGLVVTYFDIHIPHVNDQIRSYAGIDDDIDDDIETYVIRPGQWFQISMAGNVGWSCCSGWWRAYVTVLDTKPGTDSLPEDDDYESYQNYVVDYDTAIKAVDKKYPLRFLPEVVREPGWDSDYALTAYGSLFD